MAPTFIEAIWPPRNSIMVGCRARRSAPACGGVAAGARVLDVHLGDHDLAAQLLGDLLQGWGDLLAGAAPFGPEIHQHGGGGLKHVALERLVVHGHGGHVADSKAGSGRTGRLGRGSM
jgi:hypothetical protein